MSIYYRWSSALTVWLLLNIYQAFCSEEEDTLIIDLFKNYNSLIRPVKSEHSAPILVLFGLAMILLINVDEKNQIMQTNVWLTMKWEDYQLSWEPKNYGNIKTIRVPPDKVWLPDVVLFNNADGNYEVSFYSNVVIEYTGNILWVPPAIYKSSCTIEVEYFPFDEQECTMIFGSWTYNGREVQLGFLHNKDQVELNDYSNSGIWDITKVPGELIKTNSSIIKFSIHIRRKTLFYTVILIIPTVLMAFLSMLVFYLPADASEKITLAISILLALVVFLLLVSKILPPTSSTIPLMAKYLLLTFVMNIVTISVTVVIINVYFRGPTTHRMQPCVKWMFLNFLPLILLMRRPKFTRRAIKSVSREQLPPTNSRRTADDNFTCSLSEVHRLSHLPNCSLTKAQATTDGCLPLINHSNYVTEVFDPLDLLSIDSRLALDSIQYISQHMLQEDEYRKVRDNWRYIAKVIDRLLMYTFFGVTVGGTLGILLSAPNVFTVVDQAAIIAAIKKQTFCSEDEDRLMIDVFKGYNNLIQPVLGTNETMTIKFGLQLVLLINVDEKNQIVHTNVWITLKWFDFHMIWKPEDYGDIKTIRVASDKVWLPDVVLFNNADGQYEVSYFSNVVIEHNGQMLWVPPAIYKSSCTIDVQFFPFDEQACSLIFGSWTYNESELIFALDKTGIDLEEYAKSSIWDLVEAPATLRMHKSRIEFRIRIRRKPLFYTVVLIIPTVLMAFLSMMVFYLPAGAGEKVTLTISVLLSLVVFLLLVSKILPPTSKTIPLMAKYLLLTFVLNIITILVTVIIINVFFRGPTTHKMPNWVHWTFLNFLPRLLLMKRPKPTRRHWTGGTEPAAPTGTSERRVLVPAPGQIISGAPTVVLQTYARRPTVPEMVNLQDLGVGGNYPLTPDALRSIEAIDYITEHLKQDEEYKQIRDDWKYVAMVIDRLLLYIFFGVTLGGTLGILLSAPNVFDPIHDQQAVKDRLVKLYKGELED